MADLDDTELCGDSLVGGEPERAPGGKGQESEVDEVLGACGPGEHLPQVLGTLGGPVGKVGPDRRIAFRRVEGREERLGVRRIDWANHHVRAV